MVVCLNFMSNIYLTYSISWKVNLLLYKKFNFISNKFVNYKIGWYADIY